MSILSTLLKDISDQCETQRGTSLGVRNRYLFDTAYEQVGFQQMTSRSLSTKKSSKKQTTQTLQTKVKACFKILHVMNKKFRTSKYFAFIKLEESKNQIIPSSINNQNDPSYIKETKQQTKVIEQVQSSKSVSSSSNVRKLNKIKQIMDALYLKYYSVNLKQYAFNTLKHNSMTKKNKITQLQSIGSLIKNKVYSNSIIFMDNLKMINKRIQQVQLFQQMLNSTIKKINQSMKKQWFEISKLQSSKKLKENKYQTLNNINFSQFLESPINSMPSTRKAQYKPNIQKKFQANYSLKSLDSLLTEKIQQNIIVESKPFMFESLSNIPNISYQLEQKSFNFKGKSNEHVPVQLNKLYKDNIVIEVHDIGESKLFSASQYSAKKQSTFTSTTPSSKTFNLNKHYDSDYIQPWEKSQELFPISKTQSVFDKEKFKQQKAFFMNEFEKRPTSTYVNSSAPNSGRKLNSTLQPQSSSQALYSNPEMIRLAQHYSTREKSISSITPKSCIPTSPYLNYLDSQDFKYRNSLKNPSLGGQVKKIAQIAKFRLPSDKARYS